MQIMFGKVLKPQGILGELKLSCLCDGYSAIKDLDEVFINSVSYKVLKISFHDNSIFLSLRGIFDRNSAELLRGAEVYCDKEKINKEEFNYFIEDLIGCELFLSSGKKIGEITDIASSSVDIFTVITDEGEAYFPFLKELNAHVDLSLKKITIDAKKFTEVVLYKNQK